MPSVQRGPIDFSGDGLVGTIDEQYDVLNIINRFYMTYDGGYLITFFNEVTNFFSRHTFFFYFFFPPPINFFPFFDRF